MRIDEPTRSPTPTTCRQPAIVGLVAVLLTAMAPGRAQAQAPSGYALVSQMAGKPRTLTRTEVRSIFSGRQIQWSNGQRILLVLPPKGSPEMRWLCKEVLGMPEEVYRKYLLQKVFRGELKRPILARSTTEALELLRASPTSIGPANIAGLPADLPRVLEK